ncbi:MAG TPA: PQQ-dependent sugar dehydrogenase [Steroidobacteraceae bacterium]|nr:PQQ-dependent sugar dehydrogenase [Steroidobacteraceae bacterium]HRX88526.1 PQQ-dependent sugar dehydrogenase [Steroidobacteraceae bacterium]
MRKTILDGLLLLLGCVLSATSMAMEVRAVTVADGVQMGWSFAFLPDGSMLVTERPGKIRHVSRDGKIGEPIAGVPEVVFRGQGGLLDLLVDSAYASNQTIFFCYSELGDGGNSTALARATLAPDFRALTDVKVIFRQSPKFDSRAHFGCRIVETAGGNLFLTLGDRFARMQDAQTLDTHHGKVVRIKKDGAVPADNPFVERAGALPEIWSYGHRNLQGATLDTEGNLWTTEHGPQGGDELNLTEPAKNYGWPVITYGENYGGGKIGDGITEKAGMEQPVKYWVPSIAPSGLAYLTSDKYGADWRGSFFVGSLKFRFVTRVPVSMTNAGPVADKEQRVIELGQRVRDVRQGPDGFLYVLTEDQKGRIVRLEPK